MDYPLNMNISFSSKKFQAFFLTIALSATALAFYPESRYYLHEKLQTNQRKVLGFLHIDLSGLGDRVDLVKVRLGTDVSLEVYFYENQNSAPTEIKRIVLPNHSDAHMDFRGRVTNLAVTDINQDGVLDIIVPTADENLVPRLNVFSIDPETRILRQIDPKDYGPL